MDHGVEKEWLVKIPACEKMGHFGEVSFKEIPYTVVTGQVHIVDMN